MHKHCSACRWPVPSKQDPIVAIACVTHTSAATLATQQPAAAAAPELGDLAAMGGEDYDDGLDEGLDGDSSDFTVATSEDEHETAARPGEFQVMLHCKLMAMGLTCLGFPCNPDSG